MRKSIFAAILLSGFIVGTLDILLALLSAYVKNNNSTPDKVLRFIASGVFGKKAFTPENSTSMLFLGILFHYIIAYCFTTFFYLIYPKLKWLTTNKILTGVLYGIFVWSVMFFLVLPLTNTPGQKLQFKGAWLSIIILIIAIGIPLSYFAPKLYGNLHKEREIRKI